MTLLLNTITNVVNQIAKSVQLATLVPACILVLCNLVFVFPALDANIEDLGDSTLQVSMVVLAIITISYLLWLANGPFIRFLEGYQYESTSVGQRMINYHRSWFNRLENNLLQCEKHLRYANNWLENILPLRYPRNISGLQSDPDYRRIHSLEEKWLAAQSHYLEERFNHFPPTPERILPTRLGNTIAAYEHYPDLRYGIDGPAVWPRLVPILDKNGFTAYVEREKAAFDFLLNLMVILVTLGLECVGLAFIFLETKWLWGSAIAVPLIIIGYNILIANAVYWGDMTKVAFDLYRHDLRKALLVRQPDSLDDERQLWKSLSSFLAINQTPPSTTWDYTLLRMESKTEKEVSPDEGGGK